MPQRTCPTGFQVELVPVNLCEASERQTDYVPVDGAQVRLVLQRIAQDLEGQAADCGSQREGPELRVEIAWLI
ncbi:MAG: hypothetical protein ACR2IK_06425 [Chloroflexota bacterium]